MPCPVLTYRYGDTSTERSDLLRLASGTDEVHHVVPGGSIKRYCPVSATRSLGRALVVSSRLCCGYAMLSSEPWCLGESSRYGTALCLAVSAGAWGEGEAAYAAMKFAVLTYRRAGAVTHAATKRAVYWRSVCCYEMCGTEITWGEQGRSRGCGGQGSLRAKSASYAMSGTHIAYAAISLHACYVITCTHTACGSTGVCATCNELAYGALSPYARAMRSAEGVAVDERGDILVVGSLPYPPTPCPYRYSVCPPIPLRAPYAVSGTDTAYVAISLRSCYALSSTHIACGAVSLQACYAMSGTERAYRWARVVFGRVGGERAGQ
eukprot:2549460-Rhodomonas_salina.3